MEHKISSPIPVKDAELLAYQARKVSAPELVEYADSRSGTNGRKRSTESNRRPSGNQRDGQSHVVQRKTSVSDLLSRLTMPTAASRSKMRDPASRSPSSTSSTSAPLRSPKISSPRRFSNPNGAPKPRPVGSSSNLAKDSRSLSSGSTASQPFSRKPPSPPVEIRPRAASAKNTDDRGSGQDLYNHASESAGSQVGSHVGHAGNNIGESDRNNAGNNAGHQTTGRHTAGHHSSGNHTGTPGSTGHSSRSAHSSVQNNGQAAHNAAQHGHKYGTLSPPGSRSVSLGHARRQSAPAPAQNMTSPRAMSRAAQPLQVDAAGKSPIIPSQLPSPTENELAAGLPVGKLSSATSLATSQTLSVDSDADLRLEVAQLRELNQSLRDRNKQLRSRLDEALAIQDQLNVELSVSEAGRCSLQQQVNGYSSLQHEMERKSEKIQKRLQRSQKLAALLKFNIQDLKMALEEKHLENYRLAKKLKESGLEPLDFDMKMQDSSR